MASNAGQTTSKASVSPSALALSLDDAVLAIDTTRNDGGAFHSGHAPIELRCFFVGRSSLNNLARQGHPDEQHSFTDRHGLNLTPQRQKDRKQDESHLRALCKPHGEETTPVQQSRVNTSTHHQSSNTIMWAFHSNSNKLGRQHQDEDRSLIVKVRTFCTYVCAVDNDRFRVPSAACNIIII